MVIVVMRNQSTVIPLNRGGVSYKTLNTENIPLFGDVDPIQIAIAPHIILSKSIQQTKTNGYNQLHETPVTQLIDIFKEASKIFRKKIPLTENLDLSLQRKSRPYSHKCLAPSYYLMPAKRSVSNGPDSDAG